MGEKRPEKWRLFRCRIFFGFFGPFWSIKLGFHYTNGVLVVRSFRWLLSQMYRVTFSLIINFSHGASLKLVFIPRIQLNFIISRHLLGGFGANKCYIIAFQAEYLERLSWFVRIYIRPCVTLNPYFRGLLLFPYKVHCTIPRKKYNWTRECMKCNWSIFCI